MPGTNADVRVLGGFVWSIAEILRGDFKQSEYGKVILPFIVLRRLDCLLEASKRRCCTNTGSSGNRVLHL